MDIKKGDYVRFLNDVGGGHVSRIEGKMIYVEDEDGFERLAPASELVVVQQGKTMGSPAKTCVWVTLFSQR